jgi:hypothetical protein
MRLAQQFNIIQIGVRRGRIVKELVCDAHFLKGNSGMAHPVCGFSGNDLLDSIPAQESLIRAAALALKQDTD